MKKLLVLTAAMILTSSLVGCECLNWFRRGACNPCQTTPTYGAPVMSYPASDACDSCGVASEVTPGPAPYTTIPSGQ